MKVSHVVAPLMLALVAVACSDSSGPTTAGELRNPSLALVAPPSGPDPLGESIIVCKTGGEGSYDFTYTGTDFRPTGGPISGGFSLLPGQCWSLGFFGGIGASVDITETPRVGHNVVSIDVDQLAASDRHLTGTNTVTGVLGSGNPTESAVVTFTNEVVSTPEDGTQGCTPGYWKNHPASWAGTGYTTGQTAGSVFSLGGFPTLGSLSLSATLAGGGGSGTLGAAKILLRAGTAALLNAGNAGVDYTMTTAEIITAVNAALATNNRDTIIALAASIDADNNLGCPLN